MAQYFGEANTAPYYGILYPLVPNNSAETYFTTVKIVYEGYWNAMFYVKLFLQFKFRKNTLPYVTAFYRYLVSVFQLIYQVDSEEYTNLNYMSSLCFRAGYVVYVVGCLLLSKPHRVCGNVN